MAEVEAALADPAVAGVVLVGEGGVGKTHLARHALATAEAAGFTTGAALATRAAATVPLGAFAPLLGDLEGRGAKLLAEARRTLLARAAESPLVLLVDDAHLLDPTSATLVLQLAAAEAVVVVATVRSGEPVPDPVTALWKDAGARRIDLAPLGPDDVDALLHRLLDGPVALHAARTLGELSRGNPMALCELVRATRRTGALVRRDDLWHLDGDVALSDRLTDLVGDRLADLAPDELDALATVALGEPLPLAVAVPLVGLDRLRALEDRHLVEVRPRPDDDVGLAHPLYGEVALRTLGELHRRDLLAGLADATEANEPPGEATTLRLATWRLEAGGPVDPDLLVAGARIAYVANDHEHTAGLASAAWERARGAEAGHLLGFALGRLARAEEAEAVLAEATEAAGQAGDDRLRVLVALARSENLFRGLCRAEDALACVAEAEQAVADPTWRAELVAHRAMLGLQVGEGPAAMSLLEPLLEEGTPDRPFVKAAYAAGPALALDGHVEQAADLAGRALPVHERVWTEDLFQTEPAVHHVTAILALVEGGRLVEAEAYAALGMQVASEVAEGYGLGYMSMLGGLVALRRGLPVTARRRCLEAVPHFEAAGFPAPQRWVLAGAATAEALLGDVEAARAHLLAVDELADRTPVVSNEAVVDEGRAWVRVAEGAFDEARAGLVEAAERARARGERAGAGRLLHVLARVGGAAVARDGLAVLAEELHGELVDCRAAHAAALVAGDGAALEDVSERLEALGSILVAAEAAAEAARAHRRAGDPRAAARAAHRLSALAAACEGARTPALVLTDAVEPLTSRELEIALLVAEGLTSREVAERLVVSPRTVDNHLQRIFAKLGISRRAELGDALSRQPG